jgi:hypothetical protein
MAKKASDNQNISCVKKKQNSGFANFALINQLSIQTNIDEVSVYVVAIGWT